MIYLYMDRLQLRVRRRKHARSPSAKFLRRPSRPRGRPSLRHSLGIATEDSCAIVAAFQYDLRRNCHEGLAHRRPAGLLSALGIGVLAMAQRNYEGEEEGPDLPVDPHEQAEWAFARFHFPNGDNGYGGFRGFQLWAADYPKADRQFVRGLRRLTRLNARAMEQIVDAEGDKLFDWPWIYMEHGNGWNLNQAEAARLRTYLLRGGFLFSDDTHGDYEWDGLMQGLRADFPRSRRGGIKK